jgi:AsmA protein
MSLLRWIFGFIITLLVLIAVAILVAPKFFNPNDYRDQITQLVKDQTQRDLLLEGDLKLSVFPRLGVTTGKLSFSQPTHLSASFGEGNMLEVGAAKVHLRVLPLLKSLNKEVKDIQIDTIVLQQPQVEIITLENGLNSLSGLSGSEEESQQSTQQTTSDQKAAAAAGVALVVQGVDLQSGRLVWDDRQSGQRYELREFNINTGNLIGKDLADIVVSGEVIDSASPDITQFDLKGKARVDVESLAAVANDMQLSVERGDISASVNFASLDFAQNAQIVLQQLTAKVSTSDEELGPVEMDISAPNVSFDQVSQLLLVDALQAKGLYQERPVGVESLDLRFSLKDQNASLESLSANFDGVMANLKDLRGSSLFTSPEGSLSLDVPPFDARRLISSFDIDFKPSNENALSALSMSTDFSGSLNQVALQNLTANIDGSQLNGFVVVNDFTKPRADFDIKIDQINLDDYIPVSEEEATQSNTIVDPDQPSGLAVLFALFPLFEQFKANGDLNIGNLVATQLKIQNINVNVKSDQNSTTITPSAQFYGGSFDSTVIYRNIDGGSQLKFTKTDISSVDIEGLFTDMELTDQVSGNANISMDVVAEKKNNQESTKGVVTLLVKDGALKGIDIQKILKKANSLYSSLKGREEVEEQSTESDETRFTSLGGTFNLVDDLITNSDFEMKAPLFRVNGAGEVYIDRQELDYTVGVSVVNSSAGQGGESLGKLKGITLPVRFTGPLSSPKYRLDMKALFKSALDDKVDQRKEALLKEKLGIEGGGKLSTKEIISAAIGKKLNDKYGPKDSESQTPQNQSSAVEQGSNSGDLNKAPAQQSQQSVQPKQPPKTKEERKRELKDELKRKALESLFGG